MNTTEKIYKCFVEARCSQLFYTQCIDETCTNVEREFFQNLALDSTKQVLTINNFAKENFGISFMPNTFHTK